MSVRAHSPTRLDTEVVVPVLLDRKFVAIWTAGFIGALLAQVSLFTTHGRWNNLLPALLSIGLWMGATLHATDRQRIWWRRVVGAALNVGLAVGIGLIPSLVLILLTERGANLDDALVLAVAGPLSIALVSAMLSTVKVGVLAAATLRRPGSAAAESING